MSLLVNITRRIFLTSLITLSACQNPFSGNQRPQPLSQDPEIQVYFNHNQARGADYSEPYRQLERTGNNLEQIIIEGINSAQKTVDIAVQEFRLPNIAQALVKRQQAGVRIRVILENSYSRPLSELSQAEVGKLEARDRQSYEEFRILVDVDRDGRLSEAGINQRDALVMLKNAGIPLINDTADGSKGSSLMHHKFAIIDGKIVLTGSANWTTSDIHGDFASSQSRGNANNLLKIENQTIANLFTEEFNLMWGDGPGNNLDSKFGLNKPLRKPQTITLKNTTITLHFSPTSPTQPWLVSSNGLIAQTLTRARKSIDLALFVFSEQKLANTLENAYQNGANIRTLIEPSFAFRYYSEGLDMLGVALSYKCRYESDNRPWKVPLTSVGIPQLPPGDRLHHKFGVIDEQIVITGSHNWSEAANEKNDETLLIIQSPIVAAHFNREFNRLYDRAALGIPTPIQQKMEAEATTCPQLTTTSSSPSSLQLVNLNTATQEELETLPSIGPKLARRILEARQEKPFTSLADLDRVAGIGPSTLKKLEGRVSW